MNMNKNKTNRYMPFIMALCVVLGIIIGTFFSNHFAGNRLNVINSGSNRLNNLLHLIDDQYVDAVNIDSLVDKAIPQILAELDPHRHLYPLLQMQNDGLFLSPEESPLSQKFPSGQLRYRT